jgi:hypothetical protein
MKWLLNDKNIFIRSLWKPSTMPWLTDKHNMPITKELANTADRRLYAGSFSRNEYDDTR